MPQDAEQLAPLPTSETTDDIIGPTVPRLDVQIVNKTTEVNNYQRRIDALRKELESGSLVGQDLAEASEDLQFTEQALQTAQETLDGLMLDRTGASVESIIDIPSDGERSAHIEALTDEAEAIAGLANIPQPKE